MQIYGIKNCDTVKKAIKWLQQNEIEFEFFDFKKDVLTPQIVEQWFTHVDLNLLINKRGTTWRQLDDSQKNFDDVEALKSLVLEKPTLVKRPVVQTNDTWQVGFKADEWQQQFTQS